ncbi:glycoside hydrolase family 43 protein [Pedobacter sp. GR22-6]|uniref:glycoside hydrolase family 43 protein n=1 Tax=Pedobacter sp. GR22-6 TaxID=3127957 RepID=UPI00307EC551
MMSKLKHYLFLLLVVATQFQARAQKKSGALAWGDQRNGTYNNPVLNADYSDPDLIRVGETYYMVCSDFHFMGMPVLSSTDLVNWKIVGQVYHRLDISDKYDSMNAYGSGSWAPSIRYHDGKFFVYFCTPDEGLYLSTATKASGPWSPIIEVKRIAGWEDPYPFWDNDGQAYLGHSKLGGGPIILHKMSPDGKQLIDEGKTIYEGPTAEGTKIYKRNGYYYIIIPEGGVSTGYQTALRSKHIYGPYERKIVLEQGSTTINGPHQGGLVEDPDGNSWFMHFQSVGTLGRVCHLQPVKWENDWPVMGVDYDHNGIGEPVTNWKKPSGKSKSFLPQAADEFNQASLGLQWQWNHNPVDAKWSLSKNKGYLRLEALKAENNKAARNTLSQKLMGSSGTITTLLLCKEMKNGQKAGLSLIGNNIHEVGIIKRNGRLTLFADNEGKQTLSADISQENVFLRIVYDLDRSETYLQYSLNGQEYLGIGERCNLSGHNYWKAVRPALFSYTKDEQGAALFDYFHVAY